MAHNGGVLVAAGLSAKLDETNGHPVGIALGFFGICFIMIALFVLMVWVGKMRDRTRPPREAPQYPVLVKADEERERRRQSRR